jgi:hypothetical protein
VVRDGSRAGWAASVERAAPADGCWVRPDGLRAGRDDSFRRGVWLADRAGLVESAGVRWVDRGVGRVELPVGLGAGFRRGAWLADRVELPVGLGERIRQGVCWVLRDGLPGWGGLFRVGPRWDAGRLPRRVGRG